MSGAGTTTIYLVRHGETEWNQNAPGYCGWTDIPLNAKGRLQADALGRRFATIPLARVISSDLGRSIHTAEVIAGYASAGTVETDEGLRELNYGEWEGRDGASLARTDATRFEAWQTDPGRIGPPGGETHTEVLGRAAAALEARVDRFAGEAVVVVSHKTTVLLLLCWALGLPVDRSHRILQQNAAVNIIYLDGARRSVGLVNDTSHLPGDLCSPAR